MRVPRRGGTALPSSGHTQGEPEGVQGAAPSTLFRARAAPSGSGLAVNDAQDRRSRRRSGAAQTLRHPQPRSRDLVHFASSLQLKGDLGHLIDPGGAPDFAPRLRAAEGEDGSRALPGNRPIAGQLPTLTALRVTCSLEGQCRVNAEGIVNLEQIDLVA